MSVFLLPASLCLRSAPELHAALRPLLGEAEVALDVSAIAQLDTAGIQVLCAFATSRARDGRSLTWRGTSTPLAEAVRLLGLSGVLPVPGVRP